MRSKAPLAMMEQMVMILVFALAAALCLQAFVKSDQLSRTSEARDHAAVLCQSAAEAIQASGGDIQGALTAITGGTAVTQSVEGGDSYVEFDEEWTPVFFDGDGESGYRLIVSPDQTEVPGLGRAAVCVRTTGGASKVLFELEVAWQEVSGHE